MAAIGYSQTPTYGEKHAAKEFFEALQFLIPCEVCRQHYKKNLQDMPISPHLDRREDLFRWTVNIHNQVNKTLNKPIVTESEAIRYYFRLGNRGRTPVITTDDFNEADTKSFVKGLCVGGGTMLVVGGLIWFSSKARN